MKKDCGSGRFRIRGWSLLQQKKGEKVSSGTIIEVGGAHWALEVWPKGADCSTEGWLRLALACSACPDKAFPKGGLRSTYSLAVVNPNGGDNMTKDTGARCCVFKNGEGWGWDDFMKFNQLEKSFIKDDEVIFEGTVTVIGQEVVSKTSLQRSPSQDDLMEASLAKDMKRMYTSGKSSDIVLKTGDETLHAHSVVLAARSPVFDRMLSTQMKESHSGIVEIDDVDINTLRRLTEFLYTDAVDGEGLWDDPDAAGSLLQAAVKYDVSSLVSLCARKVAEMVTVENAADWLTLATRVGQRMEELKEQCLRLIAANLAEVQETDGWRRLMQDAQLVTEVAPLLFKTISPPPQKKSRQS